LDIGEVHAFNLYSDQQDLGPWTLSSDARGERMAERLVERFAARACTAARSAGAPPRVDLVTWWVSQLARGKKQSRIDQVIQLSIELCETLESRSLDVPIKTQEPTISAGLRRDRYDLEMLGRARLYDHVPEAFADTNEAFSYWSHYIWEGFRRLTAS